MTTQSPSKAVSTNNMFDFGDDENDGSRDSDAVEPTETAVVAAVADSDSDSNHAVQEDAETAESTQSSLSNAEQNHASGSQTMQSTNANAMNADKNHIEQEESSSNSDDNSDAESEDDESELVINYRMPSPAELKEAVAAAVAVHNLPKASVHRDLCGDLIKMVDRMVTLVTSSNDPAQNLRTWISLATFVSRLQRFGYSAGLMGLTKIDKAEFFGFFPTLFELRLYGTPSIRLCETLLVKKIATVYKPKVAETKSKLAQTKNTKAVAINASTSTSVQVVKSESSQLSAASNIPQPRVQGNSKSAISSAETVTQQQPQLQPETKVSVSLPTSFLQASDYSAASSHVAKYENKSTVPTQQPSTSSAQAKPKVTQSLPPQVEQLLDHAVKIAQVRDEEQRPALRDTLVMLLTESLLGSNMRKNSSSPVAYLTILMQLKKRRNLNLSKRLKPYFGKPGPGFFRNLPLLFTVPENSDRITLTGLRSTFML